MRTLWTALGIVVVITASSVWTATTTVNPSTAGQDASPIGPNEVKPSDCSSITLTNTVSGGSGVVGTAASDLVVGGAGSGTIEGRDGDDCIVAGGGDDSIDGGAGTDICLGGPGTDEFTGCEVQSQ